MSFRRSSPRAETGNDAAGLKTNTESWQIVPTILGEMLQDKNAARSKRVMHAMLQMDRIDIAGLKQAYEQK